MGELPFDTDDPDLLRAWAADATLYFMREDEHLVVPSWENVALLIELAGEGLARSTFLRAKAVPHFLRSEALAALTDSRDSIDDFLGRMGDLRRLATEAGADEIVALIDRFFGYAEPAPFDHERAVQAALDVRCCQDESAIVAVPRADGGWTVPMYRGTLLISADGRLAFERYTVEKFTERLRKRVIE